MLTAVGKRVNLRGHDSLHPKSMGFLLPLPFYLLVSLSFAPDPKMDPFWRIQTGQLRGVPLPLSSHTCKIPDNK